MSRKSTVWKIRTSAFFKSFSVAEMNFFQSFQGYGSLRSSSCKNALCTLNCCIMRF